MSFQKLLHPQTKKMSDFPDCRTSWNLYKLDFLATRHTANTSSYDTQILERQHFVLKGILKIYGNRTFFKQFERNPCKGGHRKIVLFASQKVSKIYAGGMAEEGFLGFWNIAWNRLPQRKSNTFEERFSWILFTPLHWKISEKYDAGGQSKQNFYFAGRQKEFSLFTVFGFLTLLYKPIWINFFNLSYRT